MKRSLLWLGLLAALALLVAACGSDDRLSAETYFASLEEVFDDAETRGEGLFEALGDQPDAEAVATFLVAEQELFSGARPDIAALSPPSELAAAHKALLDAMDAAIDEIERARETGTDSLETFFDEADDVLEEFGRACATLQQLAEERGVDIALSCANE
jgi:hypothetical protein